VLVAVCSPDQSRSLGLPCRHVLAFRLRRLALLDAGWTLACRGVEVCAQADFRWQGCRRRQGTSCGGGGSFALAAHDSNRFAPVELLPLWRQGVPSREPSWPAIGNNGRSGLPPLWWLMRDAS